MWYLVCHTQKANKQTNIFHKNKPKQTTNNKKNLSKKTKSNPQMCYLLIICDFQTLCPWGTQLTDFLPTKSDFLENKFTSHLQSQAHTPVNSCIVHAKPKIRNHRAGMARCPGRALKGVLHIFFPSLFQCCVFSQKMPRLSQGV